MSTVEFRLHRPSADTAWGFRLQGGLDVNAPLTVQRVFNGSPADGNLQRGDVLLSINNNDVSAVYLKKAEDLVKTSSNLLTIVVRRTGQPVNSSQPHNDLPAHQPAHRKFDSSPSSQPKYDHHPHQQVQAPPSFGSAHHQQPSRQLPQSNIWRPPTQPTESYNDHQSKPGSDIYLPVKNQWSSSTTHHAADATGDYGHLRSGVASADVTGASFRSVGGNQHQAGRGHTSAVQDDQLFPPFSGQSEEWTSSHDIGTNQSYSKQQPASSSRVSAPQTFGHGSHPPVQHQQPPADEDETYEQKSVRDIKQMFNSPSKPLSFAKKQVPEKPKLWQTPSHDSADFSTSSSTNWNAAPSAAKSSAKPISMTSPSAMRSFVSPPKASPSSNYYDDPYSYPPPRQEPAATIQSNRLPSKPVPSQPKPGAGYSYQGIVTVTPAKTVHGKGKTSGGGGGSNQGTKKKEFDPSQSLVFQALQEENERAKRGEVASPDAEPPRARPQQATHAGPRRGAPGASSQQQQQRSARLQELLERDQAQSQQADHLNSGVQPSPTSPHMSAQARREMSPSYPHFQQHGHQPNQQQKYQQAPAPTAQQRHHQHQSAATNHQQHHQQQQYHQQYQQSSSPSYGYQQPQYQSYHGGYESYDSSIPISDF